MLSRVIIKNFKSIGERAVDLELKPLTILVGPNGGGKSSILEGMLLAWKGKGTNEGRIVAPWLDEWVQVEWLLHKRQRKAVPFVSLLLIGEKLEDLRPCFTYVLEGGSSQRHWGLLPSKDGSFQEPPTTMPENIWRAFRDGSEKIYDSNQNKIFFVSGSRGRVPVRGHTSQDPEGPSSPGIFGEYLLPYLARILTSNEQESEANFITKWAGKFDVSSLKAGPRGQDLVGTDYVDPDLNVALQLALASTGARQVLAVIAHIFGSKKGSLIMIEEPEISLHPESQVKLVEMFAEAIKDGKQIIITTHSSLLVLSLNRPIRKGVLKRDDVAIYDVTKTSKGTQVTPLELTDKGYIKGWIPSFKKVEQELMREWVQSLPEA